MGMYAELEKIFADQSENAIESVEFYYGLDIELYRQLKNDVYSSVHGRNAGGSINKIKNFIGVIHGDDFMPSSDAYSGNFVSGYLYTREPEVKVGDVLSIVSSDGKSRRYTIDKRESVGFTREIFTKWKIASIGS